MASRELQGPYLEWEAWRWIPASPRPPSRPAVPAGRGGGGGLGYHCFHVDTAPVGVGFAVLTPFGFSQQVTCVEGKRLRKHRYRGVLSRKPNIWSSALHSAAGAELEQVW